MEARGSGSHAAQEAALDRPVCRSRRRRDDGRTSRRLRYLARGHRRRASGQAVTTAELKSKLEQELAEDRASVVALFMLGFALAALAAGIAVFVATWAALLIVAGALGLLAGLSGLLGLRLVRKGTPPLPEQAIEEAKKTTDALRSSNGHG